MYEEPGSSTAWTRPGGQRPVYYADFHEIGGATFFNCLTEIRDDAGYEWAPDNDVEATVGRGTRQLTRAIHSLTLPVLFTHETDYIYKINPASWEQIIRQIAEIMSVHQPRYMTLDDGLRLVRTYHTADLSSAMYNPGRNTILARFSGYTDTLTTVMVFTEENGEIVTEYIDLQPFNNEVLKFRSGK